MKVGFVGYSSGKFDESIAKNYIIDAILTIEENHNITEIVSGLTDLGIPKLVYQIADKLKIKTIGLSSNEALEYNLYDVHEKIIIGDNFGDESKHFVKYIDALVRIGGGEQSLKEVEMFKEIKPKSIVLEYELERET